MKNIPNSDKKKMNDDLAIVPKARSSFSGTSSIMTPRSIDDKLKYFYNNQNIIKDSIIPQDRNFPGSSIENFVPHRIFETLNSRTVTFQSSPKLKGLGSNSFYGSFDESLKASSSAPVSIANANIHPVNPFDFFNSRQSTSIIMAINDELDGRNLFHHFTYKWSKHASNLWEDVKYIYRVDLTHLLNEDFQKEIRSLSLEDILAKLIIKKLPNSSISEKDILKSLGQKVKIVILFEGYNDIHQYLEKPDYESINNVINFAFKYNIILLTNKYLMGQALKKFDFSKILNDEGFSKGDIFTYIYRNFHDKEYYETLVDFFKFNKPIQEASKSPNFLTATCYIIANLSKLPSGADEKSDTISSVLYNLYSLANSQFESKFSEAISIKNKFISFIEEFAFLKLKENSPNVDKLKEKYEISIENINSLSNRIPIIKVDPLASRIKPNYIFTDKLYQDFIAAFYIKKMLESGDQAKISQATTLISTYREQIQFLKFLGGLITFKADTAEKAKLMNILFNAIESNTDNLVRIDRDNIILLQMEIISECQLNGNISPYISLEIINFIDHTILSDIKTWHPLIIKTKYNSQEIQKYYNSKLLSSNYEDQLLAIDFYSSIAISDKNIRKTIAEQLKHLVLNGKNYAISENALTALEAYDDLPEVKQLFEQILRYEEKTSIIIATLEIYLKDADPSNINLLLEVLTRSENPFVILKTIEALDRSHKEETNNQPFLQTLITKILESNELPKEIIQIAKKILVRRKFDFNEVIKIKLAEINPALVSPDSSESLIKSLESLEKLIAYGILDSSHVRGITKNIYSKLQKTQTNLLTLFQAKSEEAKVFEQHAVNFLLKTYTEIKDSDIKVKIKDFTLKIIRDGDEPLRITALKEIDSLFYSEYNQEVLIVFEDKLRNSKLGDVKTSILQVLVNSLKKSGIQTTEFSRFKDIVISSLQRSSEINAELTENSLEFLYYYFLKNSNDLRVFINTTLSRELLYSKANYFKILSLLPEISGDQKIKDIINNAILYENSSTFKEAIHAIGSYIRGTSGQLKEYYLNKLLEKINTLNDFTLKSACLEELEKSIYTFLISEKIKIIEFITSKISDSSTSSEIKTKLLNEIATKIISLETIVTNSIELEGVLKNLLYSINDKNLKTAVIKTLIQTYQLQGEVKFVSLINELFSQLDSNSPSNGSDLIKATIIKTLGYILQFNPTRKYQEKIVEKLLANLLREEIIIKTESLKTLNKNIEMLSEEQLYSLLEYIAQIPDEIKQNSNDILIIELIANIGNISTFYPNVQKLLKANKEKFNSILRKVIEEHSKEENEAIIEEIATRVLNQEEFSEIDQTTVTRLIEYVVYRLLKTKNDSIFNLFIKLLQLVKSDALDKLSYIITSELEISYSSQEIIEKAKFLIEVLKGIEENYFNILIVNLENLLSDKNLVITNHFPNTQAILDKLQEFSNFVRKHKIPIEFTREKLIVGGKDYNLSRNPHDSLTISKKIYQAIASSTKEYVDLSQIQTGHMFYGYSQEHLNLEKIQISVLERKNQHGNHKETLIIFEQTTLFSDTLIKVIKPANGHIKTSYYFSSVDGFKREIFGEQNPYDEYEIYTINITQEEFTQIHNQLDNLKKVEEIISVIYKLGEGHKIIMSHNELIEFDGHLKRIQRLEAEQQHIIEEQQLLNSKFEELKHKFSEFKLHQQSIEHLLSIQSNIQKYGEDIFEGLSPYQTGLVKAIIFQLETVFDAARVVQTEIVSNSQKGICGNIANLLENISPHIPFAGPAIWLFSGVLNRYDEQTQTKITNNIATLAIRSSDAKKIIEDIALLFAHNKFIAPVSSNKEGIIEFINQVIDKTNSLLSNGVVGTIIDEISTKIVEVITSTEEQTQITEEEKGEQDGSVVANILVSLISSGNCKFSTSATKQFEFIKKALIDEFHILEIPKPAIIFAPLSDTTEPKLAIEMPKVKRALSDNSDNSENFYTPKTLPLSFLEHTAPEQQGNLGYDSPKNVKELLNTISPLGEHPLNKFSSKNTPQIQNPEDSNTTPKSNTMNNLQEAVYSGGLMKTMEIWPSIKYLATNYIPIIPWMKKYGLYNEFLANNEHSITTGLFTLGAMGLSYFAGVNPLQALIGSSIQFAKPYIYNAEDKFFHFIDKNQNISQYIKLPIYLATEFVTTVALSLPFLNFNSFLDASKTQQFQAIVPIVKQAALSMAIKIFYLKNPEHQTSNITFFAAEAGTTIAILYNTVGKNFENSQSYSDLPYVFKEVSLILDTANIINSAHTAHQMITCIGNQLEQRIGVNYMEQEN